MLPSSLLKFGPLSPWFLQSPSPKVHRGGQKISQQKYGVFASLSQLLFIAQWLTEGVNLEKCDHHHQLFDKLASLPSGNQTTLFIFRKEGRILNSFPFPLFLLIIKCLSYSLHLLGVQQAFFFVVQMALYRQLNSGGLLSPAPGKYFAASQGSQSEPMEVCAP